MHLQGRRIFEIVLFLSCSFLSMRPFWTSTRMFSSRAGVNSLIAVRGSDRFHRPEIGLIGKLN